MSKGLEALERIKPYADSTIRADCEIIEQELKALEIIKSKKVDCWAFTLDINYIDYKETDFAFSSIDLTDEEIALLKEVLL